MFHVVYSRHYHDREDNGRLYESFSNTWTIYRNVPYSKLSEMQKAIPSLLKNADEVYNEYQNKNYPNADQSQCFDTEVYVVDDKDYFRTYKDEYPDVYNGPSGLIPAKEDYFTNYGQKCQFMLLKDFDESYTWYGKDWTQDQIEAEYKRREVERVSARA